jgi:hypothetical protein
MPIETALLACLYVAPVLIVFGAMAWVADLLERWNGGAE